MKSNEIWKPVIGFEKLYEVSNLGRVKSLPRLNEKGGGSFGRRHSFIRKNREE